MTTLLQTLGWADVIVPAVLLATVVFALVALGALAILNRERTWGLLLSASAAACFAGFGPLLCDRYFSARLAGAPASFQLILECSDTSLALGIVSFIACVASLPFQHLSLAYSGKISQYSSPRNDKVWPQLIRKLIAAALYVFSLAVGLLVFRSHMVSTILFGNPMFSEQLANASRLLATGADYPFRFSVILDRVSSALGFNRTTWSDTVTTAVAVGAILQGVAAFFSLYDRFFGRKSQTNGKSQEPGNHGGKLPPSRPMPIDSYRQLISQGEQLSDLHGEELPQEEY